MSPPSLQQFCNRPSLRVRMVLLIGVARRFFLNLFFRRYVRDSLARRAGECRRCGVCCHLIANKCGALHFFKDGNSTCRIYNFYRLPNCITFPIDPRDIADRNLVAPDTQCGYFWTEMPGRQR